jgi:hypothetical protein
MWVHRPKHAHDVIAPQQAVDLVSEHLGVANPYATFYNRLLCGWCGRKAAFRCVVVLQNMRDPESR